MTLNDIIILVLGSLINGIFLALVPYQLANIYIDFRGRDWIPVLVSTFGLIWIVITLWINFNKP